MTAADPDLDPTLRLLGERLQAMASQPVTDSVRASWERVEQHMTTPVKTGWWRQRRLFGAAALAIPVAIVAAFAISLTAGRGKPVGPTSVPAAVGPSDPGIPPVIVTGPPANLTRVALWGRQGWGLARKDGGILHTVDGGLGWSATTITRSELTYFLDADHAWAVVYDQTTASNLWDVLATSDGGRTWNRGQQIDLCCAPVRLLFTDLRHGWALGEPNGVDAPTGPGPLWRTTDGGLHWSRVATRGMPLGCGRHDVGFRDASTGWLTSSCAPQVTHDGGATWHVQAVPAFPGGGPGAQVMFAPPEFVSATTGTMVATSIPAGGSSDPGPAVAYVTSNGGQSWAARALPGLPMRQYEGVVADLGREGDYWYVGKPAASRPPALYHSTDGARSWQLVNDNLPPATIAVDATDSHHVRVVTDTTVLYSADAGLTFLDLAPALVTP